MMATRRNPLRNNQAAPAARVAPVRRGRRSAPTTPPVENPNIDNPTVENPNVNDSAGNGPVPQNPPPVNPAHIDQLVSQRVAELLVETNLSNTSSGTPMLN